MRPQLRIPTNLEQNNPPPPYYRNVEPHNVLSALRFVAGHLIYTTCLCPTQYVIFDYHTASHYLYNISGHREVRIDMEDPIRRFLPRFADATNFDTQVYRWEVDNRPSLKKWSTGRIVGLGDAVHPVSPYAAYGMGMAIEDGYYLARSLDGVDLRDARAVSTGFEIFEGYRVEYINHNVEFARFLGKFFHNLPYPLTWLRDLVLDYTPILQWLLSKEYLEMAELSTATLKELEVH